MAQDFVELILDVSWLNQLDDVIIEHGISLLRWRSGGVKHPHDMPPSRFPPSPNLGDSSDDRPRDYTLIVVLQVVVLQQNATTPLESAAVAVLLNGHEQRSSGIKSRYLERN